MVPVYYQKSSGDWVVPPNGNVEIPQDVIKKERQAVQNPVDKPVIRVLTT